MDILGFSLCLGLLVFLVEGKKDNALFCTACRILVDELTWKISQVDPNKKIQVGSFRIDPKGNQARYDVPYARSDLHLTELVEEVCQKMNEYSQTTGKDGQKNIVRTYARNGIPIALNSIEINKEISQKLRFYCDSVLEEHEEEIIALLKKESVPSIENMICGEMSASCTEEELGIPLATSAAEIDPNAVEDNATAGVNDKVDDDGGVVDDGEVDEKDTKEEL